MIPEIREKIESTLASLKAMGVSNWLISFDCFLFVNEL